MLAPTLRMLGFHELDAGISVVINQTKHLFRDVIGEVDAKLIFYLLDENIVLFLKIIDSVHRFLHSKSIR